jgi:hypothetical protein
LTTLSFLQALNGSSAAAAKIAKTVKIVLK